MEPASACLSDRREWPRIDLDAEARLRFNRIGPEVRSRIVSAISNSLYLAMSPPKPIGTKIRLTLTIAESLREIRVSGVVVRSVSGEAPGQLPPGVGIFLTEASEDWSAFCAELGGGFT